VRIRSIFRKKAEGACEETSTATEYPSLQFTEPNEITLAKKLLQFGEVLPQVMEDYRPNLLANYLFELASIFHSFFEACPVLRSEGATRYTRLQLCEAAAKVLRQGLELLGISVPERM
jgi:arginyl-tRNA synthetase